MVPAQGDRATTMTGHSRKDGLLPCPFCGGDAVRCHALYQVDYEVRCSNEECPVAPCASELQPDEADKSWNRRAASGALQAYMEMMRWAENERRELQRRPSKWPYDYGAIDALTSVIDKTRQMAEWTEKQG